jgi:hypothetical protein
VAGCGPSKLAAGIGAEAGIGQRGGHGARSGPGCWGDHCRRAWGGSAGRGRSARASAGGRQRRKAAMVGQSRPVDTADERSGPPDAAVRWVLAAIAVSAVIMLAACGSTTAGGAGHPASAAGHSAGPTAVAAAPLCAAAQKVDRVVASRPAGHLREVHPRGVTITDPPQVRALAAALCTLPPMPPGVQCPADFGGMFRLVFAAGGQSFRPVQIQTSGCRAVTGIGPARSWSRSPRFGQLLARTVGGTGRLVPGTHPSSVPTP